MSVDFQKVAKLFEDEVKLANYFDSVEAESTKLKLAALIKDNVHELIFLIGDPGVGKTFLLKYLSKEFFAKRQVFYFDSPFFDNEKFLEKFIERFEKESDVSQIAEKKNVATTHARNNAHTIFIDEAQLLNDTQIEFLRTLSDTKAFQIVLAMHKDEGKHILEKKHFKSRKKHIVSLERMQSNEIAKYINKVLLKNSLAEANELLHKNSLGFIQKHTKGNMRAIKRILQSIFELLEFRKQNGMTDKLKLDRCLLTMAAIDVGLIDA
jgi:type II secretory pathway predicted ATPase ExeA